MLTPPPTGPYTNGRSVRGAAAPSQMFAIVTCQTKLNPCSIMSERAMRRAANCQSR